MYGVAELHSLVHQAQWEDIQEAMREVHFDEKLLSIISDLKQGKETKPGFIYKQGTLFYEGRLVLSSTSCLYP